MKPIFLQKTILKYDRLLLLLCWLISAAFYLKVFGIVTIQEAIKYIREANRIIDGSNFSQPRYWFYCTTIFIIALALKLKIGLIGAFVLQSLLNIFALSFFYTEIKKLFQIPLTAFFAVAYLLLFWPYQSWVVFLFTESAFFSAILILLAAIMRYRPNSLKNVLIISFALLLVIISRPLGILFIPAVYVYFFYNANKNWKMILGSISIILFIAAFYIINIIFSTIPDWHITQAFEQESIICDLPTNNPSHTVIYLAAGSTPVYQLFYYVTHNFEHFLHFMTVKLQYFFLMARPYFSKAHNYYVVLNVVPLYLLALGSFLIKQIKFNSGVSLFLATIIVVYTVTIIFQCDDYHNRFILSIYPCFVVLAAKTVDYFASRFLKHNKQAASISIK